MNSIILSSYFALKPHPNSTSDRHVVGRMPNGFVPQNDFGYIKDWYESIIRVGENAVVFHDHLSEEFIDKYQTDNIKFLKVDQSIYSNNDYRFFCFRNFLENNKFDFVVHTDISDVTLVKSLKPLLSEDYDFFACKDTIKLNEFPFMQIHQKYNWENSVIFYVNQNKWDLINMGVIGGPYSNMLDFYDSFCSLRIRMGDPEFNSDMWLLQYLIRSIFNNKKTLIGEPFCSNFKKYEKDRKDVYFIHK